MRGLLERKIAQKMGNSIVRFKKKILKAKMHSKYFRQSDFDGIPLISRT